MKTETLLLLGGAAVVGYLYLKRKTADAAAGTTGTAAQGLTAAALAAQTAGDARNQISYEVDDISPEWGWVQPGWGSGAWGGFRGGGGGGHGHGGHHGGHH